MEVSGGYAFIRSPMAWINKLEGHNKCFQIASYGIIADTVAVSIPVQCIFRYCIIFRWAILKIINFRSLKH